MEKLKTSPAGLKAIMQHEGVRLNLYNDPAGHCTIGVGHLVHKKPCNGSEPIGFLNGITEEQAMDRLATDIARFERALHKLVKVPVSQAQFDALVSFTFNMGEGNLASSTLLRKLNAGDYKGAAAQFAAWNKARDQSGVLVVLPGLVTRRASEAALFLSGTA